MSVLAMLLIVVAAACSSPSEPQGGDSPTPGLVPLMELGTAMYLGFEGGLYPGGANAAPADHAALGLEYARRIQPLDADGAPHPDGNYVLLSIGMSNTTREFCGGNVAQGTCSATSFIGQALADGTVDRSHLVIVDGAQGGRPIADWDQPTEETYERVRTQRLEPLGLTEAQVQAVWIKQANPRPTVSLPAPNADAYAITAGLANIVRSLMVHYPNVQLVFVSSRIYAGYAQPGTLNPEPFAYESGFAVKWLVEAQIRQARGEAPDALVGDLRPGIAAPWIGWGPYLWANGPQARSDGLTWMPEDFAADNTHPSPSAAQKVGALLVDFLKTSPQASCWFLEGRSC